MVVAALVALVTVGFGAEGAAAKQKGKLKLELLSSDPELVTGDDALIAVEIPKGTKPGKVRVRRNGANISGAFESADGNPRKLVGLVEGLRAGANRIAARAPGDRRAAELNLFNSSIAGPIISGPHQEPYYCRTEDPDNDLGPPTDADCMAPTKVEWRYRTTGDQFKVLADPSQRPADLAQTTTRDGQTVDYVVRIESGVINRGVYRWAILAPGGELGPGWNKRMIYSFGGGCSAGHQQGEIPTSFVLDDRQLSRGYAVAGSSLTIFETACNDVLSAETAAMVKEHVIESLGAAPVWTIGEGPSGGSIQTQMTGQNYPGLLDGLMPSASFPDNTSPAQPDCRLLQAYFATPDGSSLTPAQQQSIHGLGNVDGCAALAAGNNPIDASDGCTESVVPPAVIFDPVTNPGGVRCSIFDSLVNVYGTGANGGARRPLDNVGVQYGLLALQAGDISLNEFLDLNEQIGGFDDNGLPSAARSVADPEALAIAYRTGRINSGAGGIPSLPIVDLRDYVDDELNVHQYINTYRFRSRLQRTNGTYANQVMFRARGSTNVTAMRDAGIDTLAAWLDAIEADASGRSLPEKVIADKPANAVDACWTNSGQRTDAPAVIGDANLCETTYAPHSLPDLRAGRPLDSLIAKCQLKPINAADYGSPGPTQLARLAAIFPGGVCDYSQPGVGEQPLAGTWHEFGPQRVVKQRKRHLGLDAEADGGRATLTVRLRPCPETTWQRVGFERRHHGKWQALGAGLARGRKCRATLKTNLAEATVFRARSKSSEGYAGANSKRERVKPHG